MKILSLRSAMLLFVVATHVAAQPPELAAHAKCKEILMSDAPPPPDAVAICTRAAGLGFPGAQYGLGLLLMEPEQDDSARAAEWLEKALQSGHPGAALTLSGLYLRSKSPEVQERGRALFRQALCSGHPEARALADKLAIAEAGLDCASLRNFDLDGSWTAALRWSTAESAAAEPAPRLRVDLAPTTVRVFVESDARWLEVKPGAFSAEQIHDSTVIRSFDSGWDLDGEWVESWTIHLHRLGEDAAQMSFLRTVNQVFTPADSGWKTFTHLAEGRATRAAP